MKGLMKGFGTGVVVGISLVSTPAVAVEIGREPLCLEEGGCIKSKRLPSEQEAAPGAAPTSDTAAKDLPGFRTFRIEFNPTGGIFVDDADAVHMVTGLAARVYVLNRLAFGLEGNTFHRIPVNDVGQESTSRARRLSFGINMSWVAVSGRVAENQALDFFLTGGGGVLTGESPQAGKASGTRLDFTEYVDLGAGGRLFLNHWLGLTADGRAKAIFDGAAPTIAFEGRLGLTVFFPLYKRVGSTEL